jgi:hypothetical protein
MADYIRDLRPAIKLHGSNFELFGSKADIRGSPANVRFTPESGHQLSGLGCPLSAIFGIMRGKNAGAADRDCSSRLEAQCVGLVCPLSLLDQGY